MRIPSHIDTAATVAGADLEVRAVFDWQPAEEHADAQVTLTAVWFADVGCILRAMTADEIEVLEESLLMEVQQLIAEDHAMQQDWRYYA
jgi:hypothetical protein